MRFTGPAGPGGGPRAALARRLGRSGCWPGRIGGYKQTDVCMQNVAVFATPVRRHRGPRPPGGRIRVLTRRTWGGYGLIPISGADLTSVGGSSCRRRPPARSKATRRRALSSTCARRGPTPPAAQRRPARWSTPRDTPADYSYPRVRWRGNGVSRWADADAAEFRSDLLHRGAASPAGRAREAEGDRNAGLRAGEAISPRERVEGYEGWMRAAGLPILPPLRGGVHDPLLPPPVSGASAGSALRGGISGRPATGAPTLGPRLRIRSYSTIVAGEALLSAWPRGRRDLAARAAAYVRGGRTHRR